LDDARFDTVARSASTSRRSALPTLAVGLLGLTLAPPGRAAGKETRRAKEKRRRHRRRNRAAPLKRLVASDQAAQRGGTELSQELAITDPNNPFTFANARRFRRLDTITVTLRPGDAETGPGDRVEGQLFLDLDGINTGIALDGFGSNQTDPRTIAGVPRNKGAILGALKADGALQATIFDSNTADENFVDGPTGFDATLVLRGKQKNRRR